jgi:tetratricopeptide (TPR) repeat protein
VALGASGKVTPEEELRYYEDALKIDPNNVLALTNKGYVMYLLGRYEETIKYYDKALEVNPKYTIAWDNKGVALYKNGKFKDAENAAKKAVALEPNNTQYINNWGDYLLKLERYDEAVEVYRRAIKIKETWRSYLGLAKAYIGLGEKLEEKELYEDALEHLETVANKLGIPEEKNDKQDYYFQRGYTYAKLGRWRKAKKDFLQCEGDPKAARNLRRIKNREKGEWQPPTAQVAGGYALAGISIAGLTTSLTFFLESSTGLNL